MAKNPNPVDVHVGRQVRAARVAAGMSQEKLAAALGISYQQCQKNEKGQNRIASSRLQAISSHLRVPVSYFFEGLPADGSAPMRSFTEGAEFLSTKEGAHVASLWPSTPPKVQQAVITILEAAAA